MTARPAARWITAAVVAACGVAPASAQPIRVVPLRVSNLVADPYAGRIYAATPADAGPAGNSIVSIDPVTGAVGPPLLVGSSPRALAVSSDGQHLYVGLDGATAVRQVDLASHTAGPLYPLQRVRIDGTAEYARVIVPLPGSPGSLLVGQSTRIMGVDAFYLAVYDQGVMRPARPLQWFDSVVMVDATTVIATSGTRLTKLEIDASGLTERSIYDVPIVPKLTAASGGEIYAVDGRVYDAASMIERRKFGLSGPTLRVNALPMADQGRLYSLANGFLELYSLATTDLLSRTAMPLDAGEPASFVALGSGIAYHTSRPNVVLVGDFKSLPPAPPPIVGPRVQVELVGCTVCRSGSTFHAVATITNPLPGSIRVEVKAHLSLSQALFNVSPLGDRHAVVTVPPGTQTFSLLRGVVPPLPMGQGRVELSLLDPAGGRRLSSSSRSFQIR